MHFFKNVNKVPFYWKQIVQKLKFHYKDNVNNQ